MPDDQQKSIVRNVRDFTQFYHTFVDQHAKMNNMDNYIFRGEDSDSYQLYPSALRESGVNKLRHLAGKEVAKYKNGSELEAAAIVNFYRHANRHGLYVPNLEEFAEYNLSIDDLYKILWHGDILQPKFYELYALAQHYYVPTRFLDWTFDIHVALWFAAYGNFINEDNDNKSQGFSLWIMNYDKTRRLKVKYPETLPRYNKKDTNHYLKFVVPPYGNNINLKAQKGILTYLPIQLFEEKLKNGKYFGISLDECILKTAELDSKMHSITDSKNLYLMKYVFPSEQARDVLCFLKSRGYDLTTIYPGYGRITDALELDYKLEILR